MKRVFLDINVVLDLLLDRAPWVDDAKLILQAALDGRIVAMVSAASIGTIFYLIRKQAGAQAARLSVERCAIAFDLIPVDAVAVARALELNGTDFEDDLQLAAAERGRADLIISRDRKGFDRSAIEVVEPAKAIQRLAEPG